MKKNLIKFLKIYEKFLKISKNLNISRRFEIKI